MSNYIYDPSKVIPEQLFLIAEIVANKLLSDKALAYLELEMTGTPDVLKMTGERIMYFSQEIHLGMLKEMADRDEALKDGRASTPQTDNSEISSSSLA